MTASQPWHYIVKFVIIGDSGTGKSSLLIQLTETRFQNTHDVTVGVEFGAKVISIGDKKLKLQIWDTAGQESYRAITRSYYRGATGALLVFDITRPQTFTAAITWLHDLRTHADPHISVVLVGNKTDLITDENERLAWRTRAETWAKENNVLYIETSAKTGENVTAAFENAARDVVTKIQDGLFDLGDRANGIKVNQGTAIKLQQPQKRIGGCC